MLLESIIHNDNQISMVKILCTLSAMEKKIILCWNSNQGNQGYSGNQKKVKYI